MLRDGELITLRAKEGQGLAWTRCQKQWLRHPRRRTGREGERSSHHLETKVPGCNWARESHTKGFLLRALGSCKCHSKLTAGEAKPHWALREGGQACSHRRPRGESKCAPHSQSPSRCGGRPKEGSYCPSLSGSFHSHYLFVIGGFSLMPFTGCRCLELSVPTVKSRFGMGERKSHSVFIRRGLTV